MNPDRLIRFIVHRSSFIVLFAACATTPPSPPPAPPPPSLHLTPCTVAGAASRCGTFDIAEAPGSSRNLALKVIVVPATERNESAIFSFNGGPGVPVIPGAEFVLKQLAAERRLHDEVFVDMRGSGQSSPLVCPQAMKRHDHELIEGELLPDAFIADCRREIEAVADPSRYTFDYFVDDIEALRTALGYGPIDIVALSAGTRAALTFQAAHPKSVRSMLLYGPLPPQNKMPLQYARDTQAAFDRLVADCRSDAVCSSAFPRFADETEEVLAWLGTHPPAAESGGYTIRFTRGAFAEYLRTMMYTAEKQALVPLIVHLAAEGHWDQIAPGYIKYRKGWYDGVGIFVSVTCAMDVRHIAPEEIAPATANTLIGDYRVRRQMAACEQWTPGAAPRVRVSRSAAPILIVTGDLDPVTPPRWAEEVARDVVNARVIVVNNTGHIDFNPCTDRLEIEFFDSGSFEHLDDTCAKSAKRPAFATKLE